MVTAAVIQDGDIDVDTGAVVGETNADRHLQGEGGKNCAMFFCSIVRVEICSPKSYQMK